MISNRLIDIEFSNNWKILSIFLIISLTFWHHYFQQPFWKTEILPEECIRGEMPFYSITGHNLQDLSLHTRFYNLIYSLAFYVDDSEVEFQWNTRFKYTDYVRGIIGEHQNQLSKETNIHGSSFLTYSGADSDSDFVKSGILDLIKTFLGQTVTYSIVSFQHNANQSEARDTLQ